MKSLDQVARRRVLAAAVALALLPAATWAQQAAAQEPATADAIQLDTIIVTAQKRKENVRDVPASISVITDVQLEDFHATQLTDIAAYVPGFQVNSGGSPGQIGITLRGITPLATGATVGTYLDETPLGSSTLSLRANEFALDLLPYDIERIEVLRGPQGTLYGTNTIGGLIKYVTRAPDLENYEFRAGADMFGIADAGDFGWGSRAGVNLPLIDGRLALRASYAYQRTPGYIDNVATGEQDQNEFTQEIGHLALLWQASEDVSLELSGLWQSIDSDDNAAAALAFPSLDPIGDDRSNVNLVPEPFESDVAHYALTLNWALGWADFVSATGYSDTSTRVVDDFTQVFGVAFGGLAPFTADLDLEQWTQEFRLTSAAGEQVEWQVGTFYTHEDSDHLQVVAAQSLDGVSIPGLDPFIVNTLPATYEEYAIFGSLTYKFNDRFDLSLGTRWASNEQTLAQNTIAPAIGIPNLMVTGESSESVWTYSASPRWHLSEDTLLYARVASGYRAGSPNAIISGNEPPQVDSDSLVNYEIGLKSDFMDHRVLIDVAVFRMDWEDIQLVVTENGLSFLDNAGTAKTQGVELTTLFRPAAGWQFGFNAAYTDAKLTEDALSVGGLDGDRLPNVPEWSASLIADYSFPLRGEWAGHIGAGWRYVDERLSAVESNPNVVTAGSYAALDLNADISNDRWTLRLFVKNATDKHADLNLFPVISGANLPVLVTSTTLQPRTVGLSMDLKF